MNGRGEAGPDWSTRGPVAAGVAIILALVAVLWLWGLQARVSGAIVASGQIEVDRNRQVIQHPDGGRVVELLVEEGDRVAEGALLLRLAPADLETELTVVTARLAELTARRARLEAERDGAAHIRLPAELVIRARVDPAVAELLAGQDTLFSARADLALREATQMLGRIAQIDAQIAALAAQETATAEHLALVEEDLARQTALLERGNGRLDPVLALRRDATELRGMLGQIAARRAEASERVIDAELSILQAAAVRRESAIAELREVAAAEQELGEIARALHRRIAALDLRAPLAGTIHGLTVFGPGAVLRAADPVAYLVPEGRAMVISVRIPAIHVDEVLVGQDATIRFPAFDQRRMHPLQGEVSRLSADVFIDPATSTPFYRAEIVLEHGGDLPPLVPGMPVEVFLRTADRAPIAYLLEPVTLYFTRAFRES